MLVKDLAGVPGGLNVYGLTAFGDHLLLATSTGAVWASDGTPAGTTVIARGPDPGFITAMGDHAYFVFNAAQLWRTDGTAAGTQPVISIPKIDNVTPLNGQVIFSATDPVLGNELWTTDGTNPGTHVLADINPGPAGSFPDHFAPVGTHVYFIADDGTHGVEPWITDGTAGGTALVKDLNTTPISSNPGGFVAFDHNAFFSASGPAGSGLYKSDGTADGTVFVDARAVGSPIAYNGALYFTDGSTLYKSNGNQGNAQPVGGLGNGATYQATANGLMFFISDNGQKLWRSDGTSTGTFELPVFSGARLFHLAAADTYLFFMAYGGGFFGSAWRTDGTAAGTYQLEANVGQWNGSTQNLDAAVGAAGHYVVFSGAPIGASRTDGTVAGTGPLTDQSGQTIEFPNSGEPQTLVLSTGNSVYLLGVDTANVHQTALYTSDGTSAGTMKIASLSGTNQQYPYDLVNARGVVYFWNSYSNQFDLWRSDGTAAGTFIVKAGGANDLPSDLTASGTSVYFTEPGPSGPRTPWVSDGTAAGTVPLPTGNAIPGGGTSVDGSFFYSNTDPVHGTELWIQPTSTPPPAPFAPSGLIATAMAGGIVQLNWIDPPNNNEASLRLQRGTDPGFGSIDETIVLTPGTTQYTDTGATGATVYYYRIHAMNLGGSSPDSGVASVSFARLRGEVFNDTNQNGRADPGENGLAGATVYVDANNNGQLDPGELTAISDLFGRYSISVPAVGSYQVRQIAPAGYNLDGASPESYGVITVGPGIQDDLNFFDVAAPVRLSAVVGDGSAQRSVVKTVTLTFSSPVNLSPGALTLTRRNAGGSGTNDGNAPTDLSADLSVSNPAGDGLSWIVTFRPNTPATDGSGGLSDGIYDLVVHGTGVTPMNGTSVMDQTVTFFRLFGDADGNGMVNNADYFKFAKAFGTRAGDARYNSVFDADGNGQINNVDYFEFTKRFGRTLDPIAGVTPQYTLTDLGSLGGVITQGLALNQTGVVAGFSANTGLRAGHAAIDAGGGLCDLGTPGASANGINNRGQVVGSSLNASGEYHGYLYSANKLFDLNRIVVNNPGYLISEAWAINDKGWIIANGNTGQNLHALLLTPRQIFV